MATITSFPYNPLTTVFTPPARCNGFSESTAMVDQDTLAMVNQDTSCLPAGFDPAATVFFSPGLSCPFGYYSACHDTTGIATVTTVTCCPMRRGISLSCADPAFLSDVWTTLFCTWSAGPTPTILPITVTTSGQTSLKQSTFSDREGLNAFGVRMAYQSTDVAVSTTTSSATTVSTTTSSATAVTTTTSSATGPTAFVTALVTTTPLSPSSGGFSPGAAAGVGVGVAAALILLAVIGAALCIWRRRRQRPRHPKSGHEQGHERGHELDAS